MVKLLTVHDTKQVRPAVDGTSPLVLEADRVNRDAGDLGLDAEVGEQPIGLPYDTSPAELLSRKHRRVEEQRARGQRRIVATELDRGDRSGGSAAYDDNVVERIHLGLSTCPAASH